MFEYLVLSVCLQGDPITEIGGTIVPQHQVTQFKSKVSFNFDAGNHGPMIYSPTHRILSTLVDSSRLVVSSGILTSSLTEFWSRN